MQGVKAKPRYFFRALTCPLSVRPMIFDFALPRSMAQKRPHELGNRANVWMQTRRPNPAGRYQGRSPPPRLRKMAGCLQGDTPGPGKPTVGRLLGAVMLCAWARVPPLDQRAQGKIKIFGKGVYILTHVCYSIDKQEGNGSAS